jgi:hypothetical protein
MNQKKDDLEQWLQQHERERPTQEPPAAPLQPERPTIHWTELTEAAAGSRIATEWNFYRKQVGRLLAEGHEGRWVLVQGEEIIGIWDTEKEADQVRVQRFLNQDVLIQQVLSREPVLRGPTYFRSCRS